MPKWGWKRFGFGYATRNVNYEEIKQKAKDLLSKAKKGEEWTGRCGAKHIPIVVDDEILGEIWKEEDLNSVEIGSYWSSPRGTKIQLVKNGEVVGFLWVD